MITNVDLEKEIVIGLKILAKIHAGLITFNCSECDDTRKRLLGCDSITTTPVLIDEELGEFYSCPLKLIPQQVIDWWDEYSYYKEFQGTAPSYNNASLRFWSATKIYTSTLNIAENNKLKSPKDGNKDSNTKNTLNSLRSSFNKKKASKVPPKA